MEKNKLPTREQLKTYFEKDKYPTQNQFSDLIDSLRHKEDILTNKEAITIANSLESIDNTFIAYSGSNIGDEKFPLVISSLDEEDQVVTIINTGSIPRRQYFLGNAPYTIKARGFFSKISEKYEYYHLYYQIDPTYSISRLFGNNLPVIPDNFEFGTLAGKQFYCQIRKTRMEKQVNIINTKIRFINNTDASIHYRTEAGNWSDRYRDEDTVTDHYDEWDYFSIYYRGDLSKIERAIECRTYNEDNNDLLATGYLYPGQNNENVWGSQVFQIRNIRIECNYQ